MQKSLQMILFGKAEIVHGTGSRSQTSAGPVCFPWTMFTHLMDRHRCPKSLLQMANASQSQVTGCFVGAFHLHGRRSWYPVAGKVQERRRGQNSSCEQWRCQICQILSIRPHMDHPWFGSFGSSSIHSWVGDSLWHEMSATSTFCVARTLSFTDFCVFEGWSPICFQYFCSLIFPFFYLWFLMFVDSCLRRGFEEGRFCVHSRWAVCCNSLGVFGCHG